jgi:hypothetical protein
MCENCPIFQQRMADTLGRRSHSPHEVAVVRGIGERIAGPGRGTERDENTQPTTSCSSSRHYRISVVHEADRGFRKLRATHRSRLYAALCWATMYCFEALTVQDSCATPTQWLASTTSNASEAVSKALQASQALPDHPRCRSTFKDGTDEALSTVANVEELRLKLKLPHKMTLISNHQVAYNTDTEAFHTQMHIIR